MNKVFWFDLETAGLNFWQHGIHQIAGCIEIDGEVKEHFNFKVQPNPASKVDAEALAVGGVTMEQVMAYEPMADVYKKLVAMLSKYVNKYDKKDKFMLAGFNNASFDNRFFEAWYVQNGDKYFGSWFYRPSIDVFILAADNLKDKMKELDGFKLKQICAYFGAAIDETKLHEAGYDIELTRELYYKIKERV